jgi:hypothetical protein
MATVRAKIRMRMVKSSAPAHLSTASKRLIACLIYAGYAPGAHEVDLVNGAFSLATNSSTSLRPTRTNSNREDLVNRAISAETTPTYWVRVPPAG